VDPGAGREGRARRGGQAPSHVKVGVVRSSRALLTGRIVGSVLKDKALAWRTAAQRAPRFAYVVTRSGFKSTARTNSGLKICDSEVHKLILHVTVLF
jgi:hypothetical protein